MKVTTTETKTVTTRMLICFDSGPVVLAVSRRGRMERRIPTNKIQLIKVIRQCILEHEDSHGPLRVAKEIADMLVESHDYWWPPTGVTE